MARQHRRFDREKVTLRMRGLIDLIRDKGLNDYPAAGDLPRETTREAVHEGARCTVHGLEAVRIVAARVANVDDDAAMSLCCHLAENEFTKCGGPGERADLGADLTVGCVDVRTWGDERRP